MSPAVDLRRHRNRRLAADIQSADALGSIDLVRGEAHQVQAVALHIDWQLARALGRVRVEDDIAVPAKPTDGADVVDRAHLVVGVHDRDQHRVLAQRLRESVRVNDAVGVRIHVRHGNAPVLQVVGGVQHRLVFVARGDQMAAPGGFEDPFQGQVVGLGRARRPDDGERVGVDERRHVGTGGVNQFGRIPTVGMRCGRRIAVLPVGHQATTHLLCHARIHGRRGGVVQIDRARSDTAHSDVSGGDQVANVLSPGHRHHIAPAYQTRQTDAREEQVDLHGEVRPQFVGETGLAVLTVAGTPTPRRVDALAHRTDHIGDAQLLGIMPQAVAASRTAHALHESGASQPAEQLFQVGLRNALSVGDVGERRRPLVRVQRDIEYCRDGVSPLGRQAHGKPG